MELEQDKNNSKVQISKGKRLRACLGCGILKTEIQVN